MLQGKWEILLTLVSHSSSAMCWWERLIVELAAVAIPESLICSRLISPLLAVMKSSIVKRPGQFASWYWKKDFRLKDPAWIWILQYLDFFFWDNMRRIKTAFFRSFSSMRSTTLYQVIRHSVFKKSTIKKNIPKQDELKILTDAWEPDELCCMGMRPASHTPASRNQSG